MALFVVIGIFGILGGFSGSVELMTIGILCLLFGGMYYIREFNFNNHVSPDGMDWEKMNQDISKGTSTSEIKNKTIREEYDKK